MPQVAIGGRIIRAGDIEGIMTDEVYKAISYYQMTEVMGLPNGQIGWVHEPKSFIQSYLAIKSEDNVIQQEEMDKQRKKAAKKPKSGKGRKGK